MASLNPNSQNASGLPVTLPRRIGCSPERQGDLDQFRSIEVGTHCHVSLALLEGLLWLALIPIRLHFNLFCPYLSE